VARAPRLTPTTPRQKGQLHTDVPRTQAPSAPAYASGVSTEIRGWARDRASEHTIFPDRPRDTAKLIAPDARPIDTITPEAAKRRPYSTAKVPTASPTRDRRQLANLVAGTETMPGPAWCTAVACGLATSGALIAGVGGERSIARAARAVVCGAFLVRGGAGLTKTTHHLVSWTPAAEFVRRDRRWYGPPCPGVGTAAGLPLRTR
jgi:hypothetical protein